MKILLIRPPATFISGSIEPSVSLPLGLLYIAAVLEKNNYSVDVFDAQVNVEVPVTRSQDGDLHMGDSWELIKEKIAEKRPDLVGISCLYTTQMYNAIKAAEIVKQVSAKTITVMGGSHASVMPDDFLVKSDSVDIVCMGEGEFTMLEIVGQFASKGTLSDIAGTALKVDGAIKINRARARLIDLDELPLPAYHLIDMENYFGLYSKGYTDRPLVPVPKFERAVSVITSRGCPYNCVFCSIHLHMGKRWRYHSVEYVRRHIDFLVLRYGIRHVHFEDDNLSFDANRFRGILHSLMQMDKKITWDTPNGVRVDTLTREILDACKRSGCVYLVLGVESGSQQVLNTIIDKRLELETVIQVASWIKDVKIDTMSFFVIGFPGETRSDMKDTINFALRLQKNYDISPALFIATPLPGTRLELACMKRGILSSSLTPDSLAKMTQGGELMGGITFTVSDIRDMQKIFTRGHKINLLYKGLFFIMRNWYAIPKFLKIFIRVNKFKTKKNALLDILYFKNYLKDSL